jgi:hypothetical protein
MFNIFKDLAKISIEAKKKIKEVSQIWWTEILCQGEIKPVCEFLKWLEPIVSGRLCLADLSWAWCKEKFTKNFPQQPQCSGQHVRHHSPGSSPVHHSWPKKEFFSKNLSLPQITLHHISNCKYSQAFCYVFSSTFLSRMSWHHSHVPLNAGLISCQLMQTCIDYSRFNLFISKMCKNPSLILKTLTLRFYFSSLPQCL